MRPYPKPTVVAEKLHAICLLGVADTRMKGYFDLDRVLQDEAVDASELRRAIEATFARRKLVLPGDWPVGLGDAFASDRIKQVQWTAFLRTNRLEPVSLPELIERLRAGLARLGAASSA